MWVCPSAKQAAHGRETKITGIEWDREKIVVAAILEVMPHPNADRLVLCRLRRWANRTDRADRRPQFV